LKDKTFRILLENRGKFVSGEKISEKLGVSRTAVWKYIGQLREEGCRIESVSNRGYCLTEVPDRLSRELIRSHLSTNIMGQSMDLHFSIGSTNARARELAQKGAAHGTLVAAEEQVSGRGRLGRVWVSPAGVGIWMSLILRPSFPPLHAPRITVLTALAAEDAIRKVTGWAAGIKWPNDIVLRGRKVCGILTEIQADPDRIEFVTVGIGLNANTRKEDFPVELSRTATSLFLESGKKVDRNLLLAEILNSFEKYYNRYVEKEGYAGLLAGYRKKCITLGKPVHVIGRTEEFDGTAVDLTEDCALVIRLADDTLRTVFSGDVSVRGAAGYV